MTKRDSSWLEYSVTRAFTIPHLTPVVLTLGFVWICFVTIISFAAVGYETISIRSTPEEFNSTTRLWYEKVFPSWEWIPSSRDCDNSFVKIQDGICLRFRKLTSVMITSGIFLYKLVGFTDPSPDSVDQMVYRNYALKNCSVVMLGIENHEPAVVYSFC